MKVLNNNIKENVNQEEVVIVYVHYYLHLYVVLMVIHIQVVVLQGIQMLTYYMLENVTLRVLTLQDVQV